MFNFSMAFGWGLFIDIISYIIKIFDPGQLLNFLMNEIILKATKTQTNQSHVGDYILIKHIKMLLWHRFLVFFEKQSKACSI